MLCKKKIMCRDDFVVISSQTERLDDYPLAPPHPSWIDRVNVTTGPHEKRVLITGLHTVADIFCLDCEVGR